MNTANNSRYQETETKISKTFLSLLETKDITRITVNELCKAASINRSTFYSHFEDIPSLIKRIDHNMRKELMASFPSMDYKSAYASGDFLIPFLSYVKKHAPFYRACLFTRTDFPIQDGYKSLLDTVVRPICHDHKITEEQQIQYCLIFMQAGFTMVLKHWVLNGCTEEIENMASYLKQCMRLPL